MKLHLLAANRGLARTVGRCERCNFVLWPIALREEMKMGEKFPEDWDYTSDPELWFKNPDRCSKLPQNEGD